MGNTHEWIRLHVLEGLQKDADRPIARIDPQMMATHGIMAGDVIEIAGRRRTVARVWHGLEEDRGKGVIRLSALVRKNAKVSIDDVVMVRKVHEKPADFVALAPTDDYFDKNVSAETIKLRLKNTVFIEGDIVYVYITPERRVAFKVANTTPPGIAVTVVDGTRIEIYDKYEAEDEKTSLTWEDIGGLKEVKQKIRELVELPLRRPELFKHLGIEPPKGILLIGPPGTGKTLLARVAANESGAYLAIINGPEIVSKYYGETEAKLREIFETAKRNAPAIIFIDEIDALAPKREDVAGEPEKRIVAQLLTLMDGMKGRGQVIVIGATNRPDAVDPALRRPGRFDREIWINPPDTDERYEILRIHTRNMPLDVDVDLKKLAEMTHGYTGADIAALAKEAAIRALRRALQRGLVNPKSKASVEAMEKITVSMQDFLDAMRDIVPSALREVYVEVPKVRWDDIGGLDEVKQKLREVVEWPLKRRDKFKKFGLRPPKGILLFGPPGTGKTLLAKAVATESGANFIAVRGPEIFSKWVGESEKAVRDMFKRARAAAPCVIFIDEIDALAPARGRDSSAVTERVVAQLLVEMDGIGSLEGVVVIGATNRPDILDPALLRPGRFDYVIYVPPPDFKARLDILRVHTRKTPLAKDVDLEELARRTEGYSGADIELMVREAIYAALREDAEEVAMRHFEEALQSTAPSITPHMLELYESWLKGTGRRVKKGDVVKREVI